jgi:hypothetical protein
MTVLDISVIVRGAERDDIRRLLDVAGEMGIPISEVRTNPMGLIIPAALAAKAGLLSGVCPIAIVEANKAASPARKRPARKKPDEPTPGQLAIEEIWEE